MSTGNNFISVNVQVNGKLQQVKIEKGCTFENKGCRYTVNDEGKLTVFDKKTGSTTESNTIKMTNYQM